MKEQKRRDEHSSNPNLLLPSTHTQNLFLSLISSLTQSAIKFM